MHYTLSAYVPHLHLCAALVSLALIVLGVWGVWRNVYVLVVWKEKPE